jgi:phosphate transport system protein
MLVREHFEKDLRRLQDEILRMGSEVEDNLFTAVEALQKRDLARSQQLIEADRWVNELQLSLTMESLTLIATQQPAARDLRFIATVMNIANELERIHDYVKGIGRISLMIGPEPITAGLIDEFPLMAEKTASMLHRSLDALVSRDAQLAKAVAADDDVVDDLFNTALNKMNAAIAQNGASFEEINRLGWANHNLERAADRVCNICEWVAYTAIGKFEEFS